MDQACPSSTLRLMLALSQRSQSEFSHMNGEKPSTETEHISVCVCTYRRPQLLKRLLEGLGGQETRGLFTYSIVVADNDHLRSAELVVSSFSAALLIPIKYCVESQQNIALARNKAIENAEGDFVAFIDDDEFPTRRWLLTLYETCRQHGVDGVLGPVKPHFDDCLLYTSPSPRDLSTSRMPSSA